jgi:hypothetical protein
MITPAPREVVSRDFIPIVHSGRVLGVCSMVVRALLLLMLTSRWCNGGRPEGVRKHARWHLVPLTPRGGR